jgi:hypothetical protein
MVSDINRERLLPETVDNSERKYSMKSGTCQKCGSDSVFSKTNGLGFGDTNGVFVYVSPMTRRSPTVAFICGSCGYFENYLTDSGKLAEVAKTWDKVPVAAK